MMPADFFRTLPQYFIPQHLLSKLMYVLTRCRLRVWKEWQIRWFIRRYGVDMSIAAEPDPLAYENFNHFFTRALKPDARPIVNGAHDIACPVDGAVSQLGAIQDGRIFQAKGHTFGLEDLLGNSIERAAPFRNGQFATLYLSPRDYHRIHMPLDGRLREMIYVPGRLFSVNARTTSVVPGLFARNERVIALFDTGAGPMALVLVGALFVASIETVWSGPVTPPFGRFRHPVPGRTPQCRGRRDAQERPSRDTSASLHVGKTIRQWDYQNENIRLERGAEMGRFNMGSTVIVLFGPGRSTWRPGLNADMAVRMGELLGKIKN
ncbi:MAG: phosphatidylserine decarboxylase [Gammaproteobacteria bacterium]|nr:MAG: phosphatidylserine decarboxylase [Gammaproteobacteria bacterium]